MARKVDSRLVNRRLNLDGSGGGSHFHEYNAGPRLFTRGFVAALVGVVFLGAAGAFAFLEFGDDLKDAVAFNSQPYISTAQGECGAGSLPDLKCYLSHDVERLCDPRERRHLKKVAQQYMSARMKERTRMVAGGLKAVAIMRSPQAQHDVMAVARVMGGNTPGQAGSPNDQAAAARHFETLGRAEKAVRDTVDGPDHTAWEQVKMSEGEIVSRIRSLARRGLIAQGDFGWTANSTIKSAFEDLGPVASSCRS